MKRFKMSRTGRREKKICSNIKEMQQAQTNKRICLHLLTHIRRKEERTGDIFLKSHSSEMK